MFGKVKYYLSANIITLYLYNMKFGSLIFIAILFLTSCGHSDNPAPAKPVAAITAFSSPITLSVFPALNGAVGRIYIKTTAIGNLNLVLPLNFDTGSAG